MTVSDLCDLLLLFIAAARETKSKLNPSSAANVKLKVFVSFFLCESSGSAATQAIHKEKFHVPVDASKDLHNFTKHVVALTDLEQIASTKGLGQSPEDTIARVKKKKIKSAAYLFSPFALKMLGNTNFLAFGLDSGSGF